MLVFIIVFLFAASMALDVRDQTHLCYADDEHGDANVDAALSVMKSGINTNNKCFNSN